MEAAPANHPGAIMNLHSVERGGRRSHKDGNNTGDAVVGNIILKDKAGVWATEGAHYHHGTTRIVMLNPITVNFLPISPAARLWKTVAV